MRKTLTACLAALLLLWALPALAARPGSFAYVNKNKVNIRETPGGKLLDQKDQGGIVYVMGETTIGNTTWDQVIFYTGEYTKYTKMGWMDARFLTDLNSMYDDVMQIALGESYILMLHANGTVSAAGIWMHEEGDTAAWRDIDQVYASRFSSLGLKKDGTVSFVRRGNDIHLEDWKNIHGIFPVAGSDQVIGVARDGTVHATAGGKTHLMEGYAAAKQILFNPQLDVQLLPAQEGTVMVRIRDQFLEQGGWEDVMAANGLENVCQIALCTSNYGSIPVALACLMRDGTVRLFKPHPFLAEQERVNLDAVWEWTDITAIAASDGYILGLKKDGTVVMAGAILSPRVKPGTYWTDDTYTNFSDNGSLASWHDIMAIAAEREMIAGVRKDGRVEMLGAWRWDP